MAKSIILKPGDICRVEPDRIEDRNVLRVELTETGRSLNALAQLNQQDLPRQIVELGPDAVRNIGKVAGAGIGKKLNAAANAISHGLGEDELLLIPGLKELGNLRFTAGGHVLGQEPYPVEKQAKLQNAIERCVAENLQQRIEARLELTGEKRSREILEVGILKRGETLKVVPSPHTAIRLSTEEVGEILADVNVEPRTYTLDENPDRPLPGQIRSELAKYGIVLGARKILGA
ncbi:MAG: hypothetical protein V1875_06510 [Candidatus Altiarchaeota archaeon]